MPNNLPNVDNYLNKYVTKLNKRTSTALAFSALALLLFLVVALVSPFKNNLFQFLFPKQSGFADLSNQTETESATLAGAVTLGADPNTSGGQFIQFGTSSPTSIPGTPTPTSAPGTAFYVDCTGGNDANNGTSESTAWKSLTKANAATIPAGGRLLLKKGCSWTGPLNASWNGTASNNVIVGAYGTASNLPVITRNTNGADISVTGTFITIENLRLTATAPGAISSSDATCPNAPIGNTQGVAFQSGSHDNIIRNSILSNHYAGVYARAGSMRNHILNNSFENNNMMSPLDPGGSGDAGAFGVLLWGDDNEIANNTIFGSDACSYDYKRDGAAIEVYGGQRNNIHHNTAYNNDAFTELGQTRSSDNLYAYNTFRSSSSNALFLVTRGAGDSYGPVLRTTLYNNSVYLPQSFKGAIACFAGCDSTILKMRNNIIQGGAGAIDADRAIDENYNIFFGPVKINGGSAVGANSLKTDPKWVNPAAGDLHLQSSSPAINKGINLGYTFDLDGKAVSSPPDMGAYEF